YNFSPLPVVTTREPLWLPPGERPSVVGLKPDHREALVTYIVDASPDHKKVMPTPSYWPFATALATSAMFIWSIFSPWGVVWGSLPIAVTLIGWFWPKSSPSEGHAPAQEAFSEGGAGPRTSWTSRRSRRGRSGIGA